MRPDAINGQRIVAALQEFGFGELAITAVDIQADDRVIQLGRAPAERLEQLES